MPLNQQQILKLESAVRQQPVDRSASTTAIRPAYKRVSVPSSCSGAKITAKRVRTSPEFGQITITAAAVLLCAVAIERALRRVQ